MTLRQVYHQNPIQIQIRLLNLSPGFLRSLHRKGLPAVIEGLQIPGQGLSLLLIPGSQEIQRTPGRIQSPAGIDAGPQNKPDMISRHRSVQFICPHQSLQAWIARIWQTLQPLLHQNPVFPLQVHHIPHSCYGRQNHQFLQFFSWNPTPFIESRHQFIGHRRPAQFFKRITAVLLLGIHHSICRGNHRYPLIPFCLIGNIVMVGDNHSHSQLFGKPYLLSGGNTVITGDQKINSILSSLLHNMGIQPVTVGDSVGDIGIRIQPCPEKPLIQHRCGTNPVNIIISHNPHPLLLLNCFYYNSGCFLHILHQPGRGQISQLPFQIQPDILIIHHIPVSDNPGNHRINPKLLPDSVKIRPLSCNYPFLVHLTLLLNLIKTVLSFEMNDPEKGSAQTLPSFQSYGLLLHFFFSCLHHIPQSTRNTYGRISSAENTHHQRRRKLTNGRYPHDKQQHNHDKCGE